MRRFCCSLVVLIALTCVTGCAAEDPAPDSSVEVTFKAAFAPITAGVVYDVRGAVVARLAADLSASLEPGVYYVDLRDDYDNSVFSQDGRLLFVPGASVGVEIDLAPHHVPGLDQPLFAVTVNGDIESDDGYGTHVSALHTTGPNHRGRLVWEGARAMVGPGGATGYTWSTSTVTASYGYVAEDSGAWSSLRTAYTNFGITGYDVSCRADSDGSNTNFTPCPTEIYWGTDNVSQYGYQASGYRGGQCKAFMNLVAYRSGVYHGTNWAFVKIPTDSWIASNTSLSTYATAQAGDLLRKTTSGQHAAITVRIISSSQIVVLDSNWVAGGANYERVGSHVLGYSGSGTVSDLGTYRVLNCIYAGTC